MSKPSVVLLLAYETSDGKPLGLVKVNSRELVVRAAEEAIKAAEREVCQYSQVDRLLAELGREEVTKLRRCLSILIPELRSIPEPVM